MSGRKSGVRGGNPVSVHHSCPKRRTDTGFPPTPDFPPGGLLAQGELRRSLLKPAGADDSAGVRRLHDVCRGSGTIKREPARQDDALGWFVHRIPLLLLRRCSESRPCLRNPTTGDPSRSWRPSRTPGGSRPASRTASLAGGIPCTSPLRAPRCSAAGLGLLESQVPRLVLPGRDDTQHERAVSVQPGRQAWFQGGRFGLA